MLWEHVSSSFPGPLILHGLPVSCPFNFEAGVFYLVSEYWCKKKKKKEKKLNLRIYGVHLLNLIKL